MRFLTPYFPFSPKPPVCRSFYKLPNNNMNQSKIKSSKNNVFSNGFINESVQKESSKSTPFLEILGIKLDLDDFLILGILLFLYMEEVDDQLLFIILFLLLLS